MTDRKGRERRAYPRLLEVFAIKLGVELRTGGSTPASGSTINISRGGLLAAVDARMSLNARCDVRFLDSEDRVSPTETTGVVCRISLHGDDFLVAIEFDEPLEYLKVAPTIWARPRFRFHKKKKKKKKKKRTKKRRQNTKGKDGQDAKRSKRR